MFNANITMAKVAIDACQQGVAKRIISALENYFSRLPQVRNLAIILEKKLKFSIAV
tara:strand:- start:203659 stop:203826 length:168 start_codon:yes stop_codon:yes gene_type:complete